MKRSLLILIVLLIAAAPEAFAQIVDGQVTGIDLIRKAIYLIPQDTPGHEEKFVWDDNLPGKEYLEAASIGDEIVLNVESSATGRITSVSSSFHRAPDPAAERWEYSVTHPEAVPSDSAYAKKNQKPHPLNPPDFMPIMPSAEAAEPDQPIQSSVPAPRQPAAVVKTEPPVPASAPAPAPISSPVREEITPFVASAPEEAPAPVVEVQAARPRRPFGFIFNSVGGAFRSVGGAASHLNPWHRNNDQID